MSLLSELNRWTYPVVAPLFMLGTLGRPLDGLLCRVVQLGHRAGDRLKCVLIVVGLTCDRLEILCPGHRIA